jgi:DNA-binding MarR family transcriptional regulator
MDQNELRTLKIIQELDNGHQPSQRDLARTLGISLGLVNSFLKRLVNKGYFKVSTIPRNRVRYILTPKGASEKTRLTYEYIKRSYNFYKDARHRFRQLFENLEKEGVQRVVFYGAGDLAEIAYISIQQTGIKFVAIVDDMKAGTKFMGENVVAPAGLRGTAFDRVLVTSIDSRNAIKEKIFAMGVAQTDIVIMPERTFQNDNG